MTTLTLEKPLSELRLSDDIVLPLDAVTETFAFIAKRRVGKSNAAVVMGEQMYYAGIPWVAIDPKGDWWGIRSSSDGKGQGLSVVVFGGKHGDRPLHPDSGAFMAELIATRRLTCILDVSEFSQAEKIRFLLAFATRLLQVNEEVLHLFFEECDDYIPQNLIGKSGGDEDETKLVRAFSRLIRHGGFKGIGASLITQRAALVSKNVLAQVDTFIALRTTEPLDIKVVNDRLKGHPLQKEIAASLPSLKAGEAWIISPAFLELYARTMFHRRTTFDSGRTPRLGEKRVIPTKLADVELDEITAAMASIIEQVEATDPDKLGKKLVAQTAMIERLEHDIAELRKRGNTPPPEPVEVEVEVIVERIPDSVRATLLDVSGAIAGVVTGAQSAGAVITAALEELATVDAAPRRAPSPVKAAPRPGRVDPRLPSRASVPARVPAGPGDDSLPEGERKVLGVVAQYPDGLTREHVSVLTTYRRSTRDKYLQLLRGRDYVAIDGRSVTATAAGIDALGADFTPLPTGAALRAHWLDVLPDGERRILTVLVDAYPESVARDVISEMTEYKRSTRDKYLQLLRTRRLITVDGEPRASDLLFG